MSEERAPFGARLRIAITYGWRHHRLVRWSQPQRFTEWVQWRKLFDHDPRQSMMQDKHRVKAHVADLLGPEWIIPTLWEGDALPATPSWPLPIVVKARHGCNQTRFVRTGAENWSAIRRAARRWMRRCYGFWLDEWLYRAIPRGLIVEPFVGAAGCLPMDWKFYVFGGKPAAVQVHRNRETAHSWALFAPDWRRLSGPDGLAEPPPPASLPRMLAAAALIGEGFDFVRVDFYEIAGEPKFGELSFYPGSGLDPFRPDVIDLWLGALWHDARARLEAEATRARDLPRPGGFEAEPVRVGSNPSAKPAAI